jgi:DNA recombination protein RmuC
MKGSLTGNVQQLLQGQTTLFNTIKGSLEGKIAGYDQHVSNVTATFSGRVHDELTTHTGTIGQIKLDLEAKVTALDKQIQDFELKREGAYQSLTQYLTGLEKSSGELRSAAGRLDQALKSGQSRGKWGEIQLRKCVEFAGLSEHITFSEQVGFDSSVPDLVVHLPNGGRISIDAKFPLSAYMDAVAADDEMVKASKIDDHLKAVKTMVKNLSEKKYWESVQPSPEMVVLFVPIESCLTSVFQREPEFVEHALSQKVMLASPITLICFLKAVAFGWQQFTISNNTKEILALSNEFYNRTAKWLEHLRKTGDRLSGAVESYNSTVSSLQSRFFPTLRKFEHAMAVQDVMEETQLITQNVVVPPLITDGPESNAS